MARRCGLGHEFELPVAGQSYGTVPDPAWKQRKYGKDWAVYDTVNATIGQGYMLVNPLQQAVMAARVASGRELVPRLLLGPRQAEAKPMGFNPEHLAYIHQAMSDVVNGPGTAGRARLPIPDVLLAGKTGTAQVVSLERSDGKSGAWKYRDHGHFVCFAPFDKPRYACAVLVEHGGGSSAAYPIARDVMTFLFDPAKAMEVLTGMEQAWGGTPQQRMAARYRSYAAQYGVNAPKPTDPESQAAQADSARDASGTGTQAAATEAATPRAEEGDAAAPPPSAPVTSPGPATSQVPPAAAPAAGTTP
jgi:penicillin-binding protein 2